MEKRNRLRLIRILLPVLGLALVLSAPVLYRYYGQVPKTLKEYYSRLYPYQRYAEDLAQDILELDAFLAKQKGYKGIFGMDRRIRTMHAAMLLTLSDKDGNPYGTRWGL